MRRKLVALLVPLVFGGCTRDCWQRCPGPDDLVALVPWFAVGHVGIAIQPYKMLRQPAEGAVPVDGSEPPLPVIPENFAAIDRLQNPTQRTSESLEIGEKYYSIYCEPCHGASGAADGPVNAKFLIAFSLLTDRARAMSDGMIYSVIRHGRGNMQAYGEGVRGIDRWHVVNYVRQLQGVAQ